MLIQLNIISWLALIATWRRVHDGGDEELVEALLGLDEQVVPPRRRARNADVSTVHGGGGKKILMHRNK